MNVAGAKALGSIAANEAEILLAALLQRDRAWLLAHPEYTLSAEEEKRWHEWTKRRTRGEPVAYITGEKEFFGRAFHVTPAVLIPRPATEGLVAAALKFLESGEENVREIDSGIVAVARRMHGAWPPTSIVDVGTGSGCIAVTLALERPDLTVIATDVSAAALAVAKKNAERHGVAERIEFREGDLLEPVATLEQSFLVVSNPPYIPDLRPLPHDIEAFEPRAALRGGQKGTDILKALLRQTTRHPMCAGVVLECEQSQWKDGTLWP